jgi:hypothetical protein
MKNTLFISVNTIKERTGLHSNVDDKLILPEIQTAQDMYILPLLGSNLYERLQNGIVADDLNADEVTLLDDFVTTTLMYFVLSELPVGLSYQMFNKGIMRKTSDHGLNPDMQELIDVANRYRSRAEFYKQRTIKFLRQNAASGKYPQYVNFGVGIDKIRPERDAYQASMWLGDDINYNSNHPISFEEKYQGQFGICPNC